MEPPINEDKFPSNLSDEIENEANNIKDENGNHSSHHKKHQKGVSETHQSQFSSNLKLMKPQSENVD